MTGEAVAQADNICALILSEEINMERERERENGCKVNERRGRSGEGSIKRRTKKKKKAIILLWPSF